MGESTDHLVSGLRAAEKGILSHPHRVVNHKTAVAVKGIGPTIAQVCHVVSILPSHRARANCCSLMAHFLMVCVQIIVTNLFAAHPPAPLEATELVAMEHDVITGRKVCLGIEAHIGHTVVYKPS